jgi:hypothetical protein
LRDGQRQLRPRVAVAGAWRRNVRSKAHVRTADRFNGLAIGDVNGDAKLDVAQYEDSGRLELWLGDGTGGFTPHAMPQASGLPAGIALADVTSDGHVDLNRRRAAADGSCRV